MSDSKGIVKRHENIAVLAAWIFTAVDGKYQKEFFFLLSMSIVKNQKCPNYFPSITMDANKLVMVFMLPCTIITRMMIITNTSLEMDTA